MNYKMLLLLVAVAYFPVHAMEDFENVVSDQAHEEVAYGQNLLIGATCIAAVIGAVYTLEYYLGRDARTVHMVHERFDPMCTALADPAKIIEYARVEGLRQGELAFPLTMFVLELRSAINLLEVIRVKRYNMGVLYGQSLSQLLADLKKVLAIVTQHRSFIAERDKAVKDEQHRREMVIIGQKVIQTQQALDQRLTALERLAGQHGQELQDLRYLASQVRGELEDVQRDRRSLRAD